MSFSLTEPQIRALSKDVTRRLRWLNAKPGQHVLAIRKGMGLKKGERQVVITEIVFTDVRREPLNKIDQADVEREGFPEMTPAEFVEMFCHANRAQRCTPRTTVTRIEFEYVEEAQ